MLKRDTTIGLKVTSKYNCLFFANRNAVTSERGGYSIPEGVRFPRNSLRGRRRALARGGRLRRPLRPSRGTPPCYSCWE